MHCGGYVLKSNILRAIVEIQNFSRYLNSELNVLSGEPAYIQFKFFLTCIHFFSMLYQYHQKTHDSDNLKPFACNYCDRRFTLQHLLTKHEKKMHLSKREIKCHLCHKTFKRNENLTRHMVCKLFLFFCFANYLFLFFLSPFYSYSAISNLLTSLID